MYPNPSRDDLLERIHQLERLNRFLEYKNTLLNEAVETICCAFLNNPRDLDTAIQTAMTLQQRAQQSDDQIKPR
jgi:hypothetical protein